MKKAIISIALIIAMSFSTGSALATSVDAETTSTQTDKIELLKLDLISNITPTLRVSGTSASYSINVTCISSVNSIKATLQIQQFSGGQWVNFGSSWSVSSSTFFLMDSGTRTVTSGGTYRLKADITASNGSSTASATVYS